MANITETEDWIEGIYQLEEEDLVLGGPDGIDNLQAKQLANRTRYLKALVDALGLGKQPLDPMLTAIAALLTDADQILYFTGEDAPALTPLTAFMRTLLATGNAAAARGVLDAVSTGELAAAVAALVNSSPATLDTLKELSDALGADPNFAATMANALGLKAPLASPEFTGVPTAPTAAPGTNNGQLASTAFVVAAIAAALAGIDTSAFAKLAVKNAFSKGNRGIPKPFPATTGTITLDLDEANNWDSGGPLTGNIILANPSTMPVGQSGAFHIENGATPRTIAYGSYWKPADGFLLDSLTATAGARDTFVYYVETASRAIIKKVGGSS